MRTVNSRRHAIANVYEESLKLRKLQLISRWNMFKKTSRTHHQFFESTLSIDLLSPVCPIVQRCNYLECNPRIYLYTKKNQLRFCHAVLLEVLLGDMFQDLSLVRLVLVEKQ